MELENRLKNVCLDILTEIDRLCRKHGIRYYLYGGTLLGGVRHQGFIPWDDDIDIVMFPEEFEKFENVCKDELESPYFLQTYQSDPLGLVPWAKLHNDKTTFATSWVRAGAHQGVFVDIFVFHYAPANPFVSTCYGRMLDFLNSYSNFRFCSPIKSPSLKMRLLQGMIRLTTFISETRFKQFYQHFLARYDKRGGTMIFHNSFRKYKKKLVKKEWFDETIELSFENHSFLAPAGWDSLLRKYYGSDYMQLPPEEQRITVHGTDKIDLDKSWKEYQSFL